jgi:hypothetical protein
MFSVDLITRPCGCHVAVALPGELDVADAVSPATARAVVPAGSPEIIADLAAPGVHRLQRSGSACARPQARPGDSCKPIGSGRCCGLNAYPADRCPPQPAGSLILLALT